MRKDETLELIREDVVDITFEKADGTIREMSVTLSDKFLPELEETEDKKEKKPRAVNPSVQAVYVPNVGWRSFKWEKLKTVNGVDYVNDH